MSKHLVYGGQQFQLRDDEDVDTLASRFTDSAGGSAWVSFEDHAGDHHLALRHSPFPIVLSQAPQDDPR